MVLCPKQEGPTVSFNAATTLHNFCVWQQSQNVQDDNHPSHHDTALLITRYAPPPSFVLLEPNQIFKD